MELMLVGFSVKNFRSIASAQSLNFFATSDRTHEATHCIATPFAAVPRLTRTAVLFGPNGSGKSNLLYALRLMREFVLRSPLFSAAELASRFMPFFSSAGLQTPTSFGIDLILDRLRYRYKFSYEATRIVSEELKVYKSQKSQRWFGRECGAGTGEIWMPFSVALAGPRETWRRSTGPRSLFLSVAAEMHAAQLRPLVDWFDTKLDITRHVDTASLAAVVVRLRDKTFKEQVMQVLHAVDLPVTDLRVTAANPPSVELLYSSVNSQEMWLDVNEDSAGIRRLLQLLVPLLDGGDRNRFVAIDEFDTQLHPLIGRYLVELLNRPSPAEKRIQVLLVSHDLALLDLELLRRDEVWLMESDKSHSSRLSSLAQYGARRHEIISKSYLRGRFGAVPRVKSGRIGKIDKKKPG